MHAVQARLEKQMPCGTEIVSNIYFSLGRHMQDLEDLLIKLIVLKNRLVIILKKIENSSCCHVHYFHSRYFKEFALFLVLSLNLKTTRYR